MALNGDYDLAAWWEVEDGETAAQVLEGYVSNISTYNKTTIGLRNLRHARLYDNRMYVNMRGSSYSYGIKKESRYTANDSSVSDNIVRSVVDSVVAKITKRQVRPRFLTDGGDFKQQKLSEKLNRYILGLFKQVDAPEHVLHAFRDCCIFGTGFIKVMQKHIPHEGTYKMHIERAMPDEMIVDDSDGYYADPRAIQQVRYISRKKIKELFPDKAMAIDKAPAKNDAGNGENIQLVKVVEGWAKRGPDGKPGRHIIEVGGVLLLDEEWDKDTFPFVILRYSDPLYGYFGRGLVEDLSGLQLEITRLQRNMQKSMYLMANPKVFIQKGTVDSRKITSGVGNIVEYEDRPPVFYSPNAVPTGSVELISMHRQEAYNIAGISELSATSQKPAGVDSGKAMRELRDAETERFSVTVKVFEKAHLDLAEMLLEGVREIGDDYQVSSFDKVNGMEILNWKDIKLDSNKYVMDLFPQSMLPKTPEGQIQSLQELAQMGALDPAELPGLLEIPDLDAYLRLSNAANENIIKNLELILEGKEYMLPEESDNLPYAVRKAGQYYSLARLKNFPEDVQVELLNYISDVEELIQVAQAEQAPPEQPATEPLPEQPPVQ